ncbi:hypothetical protein GCM10027093_60950 [Paraburkholderia jirisanensis]
MAVALLKGAVGEPAGLQIVDLSVPAQPRLRAFIPYAFGRTEREEISLSPDGQRLLLLVTVFERYPGPNRHTLITYDLKDPAHPVEVGRVAVSALSIALAPGAAGYATLIEAGQPSDPGKTLDRIEVHRIDVANADRSFEVAEQSPPELKFSAGSNLLMLIRLYGNIEALDLGPSPPVLYQRDGSPFGWHTDCLTALDNQRILARDDVAGRLEEFSVSPGMPRVSILSDDHAPQAPDGARYWGCAQVPGSDALYLERGEDVAKIDMDIPDAPQSAQLWSLPKHTSAMRIDKLHRLYAVGGADSHDLVVVNLDVPNTKPIDWRALSTANDEAIRANADTGDVEQLRAGLELLEDAGIRRALTAPVDGIPARKAAEIFNNYGFLLAKYLPMDAGNSGPQAYLRRAIALDPTRKVADLNLADVLRSGLGDETDWAEKQRQAAEIAALYRKYLALGGVHESTIDAFLRGDLGQDHPDDICGAIANYANAGRLAELLANHPKGVNVANRYVNLVFTTQGTAHVPTIEAYDVETGAPLDDVVPLPDAHLWGGDELAMVVYRNARQVLQFSDLYHPVSTVTLSGTKACSFEVKTTERPGPHAVEPALCRRLDQGKGPASIDFGAATLSYDEVSRHYGETQATGMQRLDVLNRGAPLNVVELSLESGAGAGCSQKFYDVLDNAGGQISEGRDHDLVMALQRATPRVRYPAIACANDARFFPQEGRIYFETKSARWPPRSQADQYHRVARVLDGRVEDVCDFQFNSTVNVVPGAPQN